MTTKNEVVELKAIEVKTKLPTIKTNFAELKKQAEQYLEKFDGHLVTEKTLDADKALMTELNKVAKLFDEERKSVKAELVKPISNFEFEANEIRDLFKSVAATIKQQLDVFTNERLQLCVDLMQAYLDSEYEKLGIEPEFRKFKPKGQLGFITKSDKLAKKGKDFIDSEVNRELAWQNKIEGRIASLEAECLKAGLKSPLSKHHIADFLYNPDDGCFTGRLESVIEAELKREAELIEAAKDEVKEEVKEEVKAEIETQTHHNDINSEPDPNAAFQLAKQQAAESIEPYFEAPKVDPNDKTPTIRMIDAKFKVKVPANVPLEKIEAKIKELLFKAGCNDESLVSIKVSQ